MEVPWNSFAFLRTNYQIFKKEDFLYRFTILKIIFMNNSFILEEIYRCAEKVS